MDIAISVSVISDNAWSKLLEDMDDKSFLHLDSHVEESTRTVFTPEGLDETGFSSYLCQPESVQQSMGVVIDQDKVHSSEELRTKKVSNNTYEELVSSKKAQGIQAVMAIGSEWLLEVSKTANTSRDAFSALLLGLLSPIYLQRLFERMGATYIKLGQFIASFSTLFPADYVTELQNYFDKAPAVPSQEIEAIIWDELILKGSQKEVAFKVLKPGIEDLLILDLNFLYEVARIVEFLNPQISRIRHSFGFNTITDVHAGNLWLLHDGRIGFLNFGIVGRISPNSRLKIIPDDEDMPRKWYNLIANLAEPLPPALNPETRQPLKHKDLFSLFPNELILQEASQQRYIDIPEVVLEVYKHWRSTPLFKPNRLEKMLGTPSRIYYKYEGVKSLVTETGAEQWGSALAFACSLFDLQWRFIRSKDPNSPGGLGIVVPEAVERALANADAKYSLCSVPNHVLLHHTISGEECIKQMAILGETLDIIVDCTGSGSNFAGLSSPFIHEILAGNINPTIRVVKPVACPSLTKGVYVYYVDITGMTPLLKIHSLGHDFISYPIHAGGLCYHERYYFARTEGLIPTPEPTHAIVAATREGPKILQHPSLQLLCGKACQGGGTVMIPNC
eukprot:Gb_06259 [translate_table: standard]